MAEYISPRGWQLNFPIKKGERLCPECGALVYCRGKVFYYNFCPLCGVRIVRDDVEEADNGKTEG